MTTMTEAPLEILLVEDNPSDRELTLHSLKKNRIANRIRVARDGAEALDLLFGTPPTPAENYPQVILLDLKLPKVSGLEVLRRVKSEGRTRSIPVVVLTFSREDSDIAQAYAWGVNSYIVKPVDFTKFAEAVSQLGLYWLVLNEDSRPSQTMQAG